MTSSKANLPLFYHQPQILTAHLHRPLHLNGERDFRFAAGTNAVPVMVAEFVEAQRAYPLVFVGDPVHPAVVLGLDQDNSFVSAEGAWRGERYIPAYVRRYPFVFIETADGSQYALGIDTASDRVVAAPGGGDGLVPLFEGDQPSQLTRDALNFAAALQASQRDTRAFCDALLEQDLLVDQHAQGNWPGGRPFHVRGFRIVDTARLQALADDVVIDWHRRGWLALIHYHLASLGRWPDLLDLKAASLEALTERDGAASEAAEEVLA